MNVSETLERLTEDAAEVAPEIQRSLTELETNEGVRRGRPTGGIRLTPAERDFIRKRMPERNLTQADLAEIAHRNPGSVSQMLRGARVCPPEARIAILSVLAAPWERECLLGETVRGVSHEMALLDPFILLTPRLRRGQDFMLKGEYALAHRRFHRVYTVAKRMGDDVGAAHAAAALARLLWEVLDFRAALKWTRQSRNLIARHFGMAEREILSSLAQLDRDDAPLGVLLLALHLSFVVRMDMVTFADGAEPPEAALNGYFDAADLSCFLIRKQGRIEAGWMYAHRLRALATYCAACVDPAQELAFRAFALARQLFRENGIGDAYVTADAGVVHWQLQTRTLAKKARAELFMATIRLAAYDDRRALAVALHVRARIALESDDREKAIRLSKAAAAVHPFGFVAELFVLLNTGTGSPTIDSDLFAAEAPFDAVHGFLSRWAQRSGKTTEELIRENLTQAITRYRRLTVRRDDVGAL